MRKSSGHYSSAPPALGRTCLSCSLRNLKLAVNQRQLAPVFFQICQLVPFIFPRTFVCALHIKTVISTRRYQHNQCPCRFFNSREIRSSVVTKLRHRDTTLFSRKQGRKCDAMPSHWIRLARLSKREKSYYWCTGTILGSKTRSDS